MGNGPEHERLVAMAGETIEFPENVDDEQKIALLQRSEGLIFPNCDDFGITAVEALASGTPVIALKAGGALDWLTEGENGIYFEQENARSLAGALQSFSATKFTRKAIQESANRYSVTRFKDAIKEIIQ